MAITCSLKFTHYKAAPARAPQCRCRGAAGHKVRARPEAPRRRGAEALLSARGARREARLGASARLCQPCRLAYWPGQTRAVDTCVRSCEVCQRTAGEYVVELLLNRKTVRGRTYYLERWQGHALAADSWEPAERLANCPERLAEYEAAAPLRPKALRAHPRAGIMMAPLPRAAAQPAPPPPPAAAQPLQLSPGWAVAAAGGPPGSARLYWGRTRAGSTGASGAAARAGGTRSPMSSATGHRPRPSRAR